MIKPEIRAEGIDDLSRKVGAFDAASRKALNTAIRVEGYRDMRLLQRQLRWGAPGGRRLAALSFIARANRRLGLPHRGKDEPLKALSQAIKYLVPKSDPIEFHFGFVGPVNRSEQVAMGGRASQLGSKSWMRIAALQQSGFDIDAERDIKRGVKTFASALAREGMHHSGRRGVHFSRSRFFFLRKSTRRMRTPARPIIGPFWQSEQRGVLARIRENFRRKLAGERI